MEFEFETNQTVWSEVIENNFALKSGAPKEAILELSWVISWPV